MARTLDNGSRTKVVIRKTAPSAYPAATPAQASTSGSNGNSGNSGGGSLEELLAAAPGVVFYAQSAELHMSRLT